MVEWNGGIEYWNGIPEYWNGTATCAELFFSAPNVLDSDESCSQSSPVKIVPGQKFR